LYVPGTHLAKALTCVKTLYWLLQ